MRKFVIYSSQSNKINFSDPQSNMSGRLLMRIAPRAPLGAMQSSTHPSKHGKREVVGYGWNGESIYMDRVDYPMPAIRFREDTQEIKVNLQ